MARRSTKRSCSRHESFTWPVRPSCVEMVPRHDMLCTGFLWQSFSLDGKRQGLSATHGLVNYAVMLALWIMAEVD